MKSIKTFGISVLCAVVLIAALPQAQAMQKKQFGPKDLPAAVRAAFEKAYPKAVIKGADKEKENGKTMYEIESMDGTTRRDFLYLEDGTIYEMEEVVSAESVPSAVSASLMKEFPKMKIEKAEKTTRGSETEYEIVIHQGKKSYSVVIAPDGKIKEQKQLKAKKEKKKEKEDGEEEND